MGTYLDRKGSDIETYLDGKGSDMRTYLLFRQEGSDMGTFR